MKNFKLNTHQKDEPIAVIGIGCRFPGGINNPKELWTALINKVDGICEVPKDRWNHEYFHDTNPDKYGCIRNAKGGFIKDVDKFDAEFFGYYPTEAQRIDPQQRLLLEVTHEAMEDAKIRREKIDGSKTAVYMGSFMYDYLCMQTQSIDRDTINSYVAMGTGMVSISNRISYDFNLTGPSVTVDTACSSSLVALHMACKSIWNNEADMGIAGGVNVLLRPESFIIMSKAGFLNPDQYCKSFDASGNGYVRSEGIGVVILKPLSKALADGDRIYSVIRATACNQDGRVKEGFTVPNVDSQKSILLDTYSKAGIDPKTVSYVEAHGPGTPVGDPIETKALGEILGSGRTQENKLLIGSIKSNLGHLEGASGIAGFIKATLSAYHRAVPSNLHFKNPNPNIDFEGLKLKVVDELTLLENEDEPITVGVNSFGAGGTNVHVAIQSLPIQNHKTQKSNKKKKEKNKNILYMLSAKHPNALKELAVKHLDLLRESTVRDLAYSTFTKRSRYEHLLPIVGKNAKEIKEGLESYIKEDATSSVKSILVNRIKNPKLGFIFSGQGGQWAEMGLELYKTESTFKSTLDKIDKLFYKLSKIHLIKEIKKNINESKIDETIIVQPAVMAIQIALVDLYAHYGIYPEGVVGHSIGEVAAGYSSGALSLEEAVKVIYHRSQAQDLVSGKGGMLACGISVSEAEKLIKPFAGQVSIGAINGPMMLTLSGDFEPLDKIAEQLELKGVFNRKVKVKVPYHSHYINEIENIMLKNLSNTKGEKTKISLYSTVTGEKESGKHLSASYWYKNARQPVLFTDALSAMVNDGFNTFVEIGPHPVLVGGAESLFKEKEVDAFICSSMTRKTKPTFEFFSSIAKLTTRGVEPTVKALFGSERKDVPLPLYPWQSQYHWFETSESEKLRKGIFKNPFLKKQSLFISDENVSLWEGNLNPNKLPFLKDHRVDNEIVFPATAHIEFAWAVAKEQYPNHSFFLENLQFEKPIVLSENSIIPIESKMEIISSEGDYRILTKDNSKEGNVESPWIQHSLGKINTLYDHFEKSNIDFEDLKMRIKSGIYHEPKKFYEVLKANGLDYGHNFALVKELWCKEREILAKVELPNNLQHEIERFNFHPALLDSALHIVFLYVHLNSNPEWTYLPNRLTKVRFYAKPSQAVWAYTSVKQQDKNILLSDHLIFNETGELIAEFKDLTCKRLKGAGSKETDSTYKGCFEYQFEKSVSSDEHMGRIHDCKKLIFIGDNTQSANALLNRICTENIETIQFPLDKNINYNNMLKDFYLDRRLIIVFAPGLGEKNCSKWSNLENTNVVPAFLNLVKAIKAREGVPRLNVITQLASGFPSDKDLDLEQSILHGMTRVVRNECPNIPITVIDINNLSDESEILCKELIFARRDIDESEIVLRGNDRFFRKLISIDIEEAEKNATITTNAIGGLYEADPERTMLFGQSPFRQKSDNSPKSDEIEITVTASALNFKDIMNSMGLLSQKAVAGGLSSESLGLEIAGRVLRVGSEIKDFKIGDEVIARVKNGVSGRVIINKNFVFKKPNNISALEGASIPVVFFTAWYSLYELAKLSKDEFVLIHSAAGGVGLAAIQLAKRVGAKIIATAGTKDKRDYLKSLGVEYVFDSRSLDFYNQVMRVTNGKGVDVILNSLSGKLMVQTFKCLAPFGRFIEIGKSDIYKNTNLGLERLGENISYFVVDVDRLAIHKPDFHKKAIEEILHLIENGELKPLDVTEFPITKLQDAMTFMSRALYRGKIVLNMENEKILALPAKHFIPKLEKSYLITGGASGLGLEIANWLVERGAKNLILVSRSGPKSDHDKNLIENFKSSGVNVLIPQVDISDIGSVEALIKEHKNDLAGIIHGAAILDDVSLDNVDMNNFSRVFSPKAQGAWNLSEATIEAGINLDFFVMISSISSVFGLNGQLSYASSNFFQDALATYRRLNGLTASSINLGVLGDYAGMSKKGKDTDGVIALLESHGLSSMLKNDVMEKLEMVLIQKPAQRVTTNIDWKLFRSAYPNLARDSRFINFMDDKVSDDKKKGKGNSFKNELMFGKDPKDSLIRLEKHITEALGKILDINPDKLSVDVSMNQFGLDSLMLTQLRNVILRSLDINVPMIKLLKGPSISAFSQDLLNQIVTGGQETNIENKESKDVSTFTIADLDEVEIINPWLIRNKKNKDSSVRLICFHSMGVGASLFTNFLVHPPKGFDIITVQTPGRENRKSEPIINSVLEMADLIIPELLPLLDRPFVIWGHSYGGIVANEVLRRLRNNHHLEPIHFMVTGTVAPQLIELWQKREVMIKAMEDENSPEYIVSLSRYVDDINFLKNIIPLMRKDYPLLLTYEFKSLKPYSFPITAFSSRQDDMVYKDEIQEWACHTEVGFELIEVDGDHWFLNRNRDLIVKKLESFIQPLLNTNGKTLYKTLEKANEKNVVKRLYKNMQNGCLSKNKKVKEQLKNK